METKRGRMNRTSSAEKNRS